MLLHQINPPSVFSCCDGLLILPKEDRNQNTIVLDANIEPNLINEIDKYYGPISDYVCTHGHMDHITHVYAWEQRGAKIHAPNPESKCLINLKNFYESFGFKEAMEFSTIEEFGKLNKYNKCKSVSDFEAGVILKFEDFEVETIPLLGHSKSHVGLYLPKEKIMHISCMGFDQPEPGVEGFGPWYGFRECSIDRYLEDIDRVEIIFLEGAKYLTSSHSYIIKHPDKTPFEYMRRKIKENQKIIDVTVVNLKLGPDFEEKVKKLLKKDLFFPKKKMKGFLKKIYNHWEYWIIVQHLQKSKLLRV